MKGGVEMEGEGRCRHGRVRGCRCRDGRVGGGVETGKVVQAISNEFQIDICQRA